MSVSTAAPRRATTTRLIAFLDLKAFSAVAKRLPEEALASALDEFYCLVDDRAQASGGDVVKFVGDGALLTWSPDCAGEALNAMLALRQSAAEWAARRGLDTELVVRLHVGEVIEGEFGPAARPHRDVLGRATFVAARLEARTLSASAEFFRALDPEARRLLKKHTPPVVYIPADDPRP